MRKRASGVTGMSLVLQELALDEAELDDGCVRWTHVTGVANLLPDALSRLWAPVPKVVPASLVGVRRARVAVRRAGFWRSVA